MSLVPNFSVTATAAKVLSSKPGTRQVNFTNNNVGTGSVYYQLVPTGTATTLTTGNGTLIPSQPNPYEVILTPGIDPPAGFDVYLISNTTAQVSVQTVPL